MSKHLVDIDDGVLEAARAKLGTVTIKDTVDAALRRAIVDRSSRVAMALDVLAQARLEDRDAAWR